MSYSAIEAESEQPYSQDFISDSIDQLVIHYQDLLAVLKILQIHLFLMFLRTA